MLNLNAMLTATPVTPAAVINPFLKADGSAVPVAAVLADCFSNDDFVTGFSIHLAGVSSDPAVVPSVQYRKVRMFATDSMSSFLRKYLTAIANGAIKATPIQLGVRITDATGEYCDYAEHLAAAKAARLAQGLEVTAPAPVKPNTLKLTASNLTVDAADPSKVYINQLAYVLCQGEYYTEAVKSITEINANPSLSAGAVLTLNSNLVAWANAKH